MFTTGETECNGIGLALNEELEWISFHGAYDFAYLLKLVTSEPLPEDEKEFEQQLQLYFPHHYDVKQMAAGLYTTSGSLSKTAEMLGVCFTGSCRYPEWGPNIKQGATVC